MDLVTVRELYRNREEYLDKEVTIGGWVRSIRDSKTFGFIVVNDGSFFENLQVVYHDNMENFGEISKLNVGAAIIVKGTLVATPQAKQPFEIQAAEVVVEYKVSWGADLQTEHERYLTEEIYKRPVFVTDYPKEIKAFYMKMNDDNKTVAAVDCLVPGIGEIIGGSQREDDYDKLVARMKELGLKEEDYGFYLDLRKYGSTRHAGFGLGFERCIMYLTGMSNIRDVIPFPRTVNNCEL